MSDEQRSATPPEGDRPPAHPSAVIQAQSTLRLLLILLALWTLFSGLALTFFQDATAATIGGGLEGGQGRAAQRLLGIHLLVLGFLYGLLAWEPQRYRLLLWVPYVAQGGVVIATAYDIVTGARDFRDAALPLIVAAAFFVLLVYVWLGSRRPEPVEPSPAETTTAPSDAPPDQA